MKVVLNLQKMQFKNMIVFQIIYILFVSFGDFGDVENYFKEGMYSFGFDILKGRCCYLFDIQLFSRKYLVNIYLLDGNLCICNGYLFFE